MENRDVPLENFPALDRVECRYGFVCRIAGIDVSNDKATVLENLDHVHGRARHLLRFENDAFATARQVHSNKIAVISTPLAADHCFEGCDGLITNQRGVCLGIYVADCCAVYLVDQQLRAAALVHSGKKGTELRVVPKAIRLLSDHFGIEPHDLVVQLSPCIRPPHYEVDFAAEIIRQFSEAGVQQIHDCGICTACDLNRYYSYRAENGRTGRMLALLGL